jgi:CRISPR system Cascade subunit CasC
VFLQIHFLTSYHATLLNRDDAGLAKRISFGSAPRLRISSQSQKRHWRTWMVHQELGLPSGVRTRHVFDRIVKTRLEEDGLDSAAAEALIQTLAKNLFMSTGDKKPLEEGLAMRQPILFGKPEIDYFVHLIEEASHKETLELGIAHLDETLKKKEHRANLAALMRAAGAADPMVGFEGAMFGRFVTSDILARVDAPVHVAHAFTTHALDTEVDFFTVVDDLARLEETGAAHANDMELGAGVFYGYVVVDVPLLVSNLSGTDSNAWQAQDLLPARRLLELLVHAIAEVTPGAKLGATAPYARADCVVLEVGTSQPRSLANAFLRPVSGTGDVMQSSVGALAQYISAMDSMYGPTAELRRVATTYDWPGMGERQPLTTAIVESLETALGRS